MTGMFRARRRSTKSGRCFRELMRIMMSCGRTGGPSSATVVHEAVSLSHTLVDDPLSKA